ncbi:MAG TPA: hypothetical protein VFY16_02915, partial [Gemmatimonadaceae bacterium]|nr:hypothetical protein [Gemmatimonadaceae bacterium]
AFGRRGLARARGGREEARVRDTMGVLGWIGVVLLVVWFLGWAVFNVPNINLLFPLALLALLGQWVLRIAAKDDLTR